MANIANLFQVLGLVCIVVAFFLLSPFTGFLTLGIVFCLIGWAADRPTVKTGASG